MRFELLHGELVTTNDPLPLHQLVVGALHAELRARCRSPAGHGRVLLPVDTEIGPDTVFGPDLQWLSGVDAAAALTSPLLPGFALPLAELLD